MWKRLTVMIVVALGAADGVRTDDFNDRSNQQQSTGTPPQTRQTTALATPSETRPATTTVIGDTGLWFVPTGEVLPAKRWSFSVYRVNFDYTEGFTDVSDWPMTFGVGLGDRAELFGACTLVRRIDRDARPIFFEQPGGRRRERVSVHARRWSDNQFGDFWLGAKMNLASQCDRSPSPSGSAA